MAEAKRDYASEFKARRHADVVPSKAGPQNMNFVRGEAGTTVAAALGAKVGNFSSPETIEFLATQHELTTGQVLRRADETDEQYERRRAEFDITHAGQYVKPTLVMDPPTARRELARLERHYRTHPLSKRKGDIAKAREDWTYMNQCRRILAMPAFDYETQEVPTIGPELHEKFQKFSKVPDVDSRIAACSNIEDIDVARLVAIHDPSDKVRVAAENRHGQLIMANRG